MSQTEQNKPVRSRDEQIVGFATMLMALAASKPADGDPEAAMETAKNHITEAEARGAAEQRRKDAEGQEPVAWRYEVKRMGYWVSREVGYGPRVWEWYWDGKRPDPTDPDCRNVSPLYERPANVPALEARIAELEGALKEAASALEQVTDGERGGYRARNGKFVSLQMSDGERADIIHADVTTECEGALETVRAALTREGEV